MIKDRIIAYVLIALFLLVSVSLVAQQRFPKPEFETGYEQPDTTTPEPRSLPFEYMDVFILAAILGLSAWFALKSRSRQGILFTSIFTLAYFGFYREGCVCSIGSIQNMSLSLADPGYAASVPVILFFVLPLLFTLFFGRIFCASACPLGVIQDLIIVKPISIPVWIQKILGLFPFIYLGLAVLYASTGTDFIICRFDPFIGIFRLSGEFHMIVIGISFLLIGMFVGRPYCRFVCPYGALLNVVSRFSQKHLSIFASKCIQCKLCTTSCPFDAIDAPSNEKEELNSGANIRRFIIFAVLVPLWIAIGAYIVSEAHFFLAKAHNTVYLADLLVSNPELMNDSENIDIKTFMSSGKTINDLIAEAKLIQSQFYTGSWWLGGFIGLVIGLMLANQFVFRKRKDFEPNKGECFSCARCIDYCPVQK
jgi:NosR/NirI family transcriptional regulator, nitrous oxide reductase regulator